MGVGFVRVLFVLLSAALGYQIAGLFLLTNSQNVLYGMVGGASFGILIMVIELMSARVSLRGLSAAVFGLLMALIMAHLISSAIDNVDLEEKWKVSIKLILVTVFSYFGVIFALRGREDFNIIIPYVQFQKQHEMGQVIVLDTSSIIDGRFSDLVQTRFLDGHFIIPRFVLNELQSIADSQDEQRRNRGRRGLEVLNKLKRNPKFHFRIHTEDFSDTTEVDQKLIRLTRLLGARLLTTDYNLNKVADFHGVTVMNVNELSNALKPVMIPGEIMTIQPVKEGKEDNQSIAYLSDGTMVVVENGRDLIGKTIQVEVTSILQTAAGRMIFSKYHVSAS